MAVRRTGRRLMRIINGELDDFNCLRLPVCFEPKRLRQGERVAAVKSHAGAYVWNPAILSLLPPTIRVAIRRRRITDPGILGEAFVCHAAKMPGGVAGDAKAYSPRPHPDPALCRKVWKTIAGGSQLCCSSAHGDSFSRQRGYVTTVRAKPPGRVATRFNAKPSRTTGFYPARDEA
jgi:hypothetical protein